MPSSYGIAQRDAPASLTADGSSKAFRQGRYGDTSTISMGDSHSALAEEGCYYKACTNSANAISFVNPAIGVFFAAGATSNQNQAPLTVLNTAGLSGGPRIYFDYIKLICDSVGSAPAAGTYMAWVISVNNYDRSPSNSNTTTSAPVPYNVNSDYANESVAKISVSTGVGSAGSASTTNQLLLTAPTDRPKVVAQGLVKRQATAIAPLVAGDIFVLDFGDHLGSSQPLASTTARQFSQSTGPLAIGPGQFMALHLYEQVAGTAATTAALGFQLDMGWWER